MSNRIIVFSCIIFICSCSDNTEEWLKQYAQTKCAYQKEKDKIKADSILRIPSMLAEKQKMQTE
jgi:hypothetical protein